MDPIDLEVLGKRIIGCAIEAHRHLGGCGLLESVYEDPLCYELSRADIQFRRQVEVPIHYKDVMLASKLRLDLDVEVLILIECKAVIQYNSIFESQLLTYMRLGKYKLGYVINFGEPVLKNGIHRVIN